MIKEPPILIASHQKHGAINTSLFSLKEKKKKSSLKIIEIGNDGSSNNIVNNETMISSIHSGMCCKKTTIEILLCILFSLIRFSFFFFIN